MKTSIDSAGRVLIPKKLRTRASLRAGTPLEVRFEAGRIVLEPRPLDVRIVKEGVFFVAEPREPIQPLTDSVVQETLEATRSERED